MSRRRETRERSRVGPSARPKPRACYYGTVSYQAFPGGDLIEKGLLDLREGDESIESLLVSIGAERLRAAGIPVPRNTYSDPERRLYERLAADDSDSAHSRYNALLRRLVSFESTIECVGLSTKH